MARAHRLGRRGEALAAAHLQSKGWRILERSFRSGHKEIDLIAARDGVVIFVEVKTRAGGDFGHPFEGITRKQRGEIAEVARAWIGANAASTSGARSQGRAGARAATAPGSASVYRFDAVAVVIRPGRAPEIEHLEDAWRLG